MTGAAVNPDDRLCTKCGAVKRKREFHKDIRRKDGLYPYCKECAIACSQEYRKNNPEKARISSRKNNQEHRHRQWCDATIRNHREHGFIVNITKTELLELALKATKCPICGCELDWNKKNGHAIATSPTWDRKYNGKRLTIQNTWIICNHCNAIKQDLPMPEFVEFCKMVVEKFSQSP